MTTIVPHIFRAYDVRGLVPDEINPEVFFQLGHAFGLLCLQRETTTSFVARDGRISSEALANAFIQGLLRCGVNVVDLGPTPTPILYYATRQAYGNGVMITSSHNPREYNGVKLVLGQQSLNYNDLQLLHTYMQHAIHYRTADYQTYDMSSEYIGEIKSNFEGLPAFNILIDDAHSISSLISQKLLSSLGCNVVSLNDYVDGNFPAHLPDPSQPSHFNMLKKELLTYQYDVAFMFDGDGDRLGVMSPKGNIIGIDHQLMLFSKEVLHTTPGANIVFDVKCSSQLPAFIQDHGGVAHMTRTGHAHIKKTMSSIQAKLGGEMSGHLFFNDEYYGYDDGFYAGCRLLRLLSHAKTNLDNLVEDLPSICVTPEYTIPVPETKKFAVMRKMFQAKEEFGGKVVDIDGMRIEYPDGWGLIRPSNTMPQLSLRFEGQNDQALQMIIKRFKAVIKKNQPDLVIDF